MTLPPLLFALAMWFAGTAAVVWLCSRPRAGFARSLALAGSVALGATTVVAITAGDAGAGGAYAAFAGTIIIWGWHEMSFLMGHVAGPNRADCPPGAIGWARFRAATATVVYHELAIAATLIALIALTWGQPNQIAPLTFALLFAMRLSAKFNLYLGVPNLSDEVFPAHLAYLKSYFRTAPMNGLFPLSILGGTAAAVLAWRAAEAASPESGMAVGMSLLAGLAVLGVTEHLFLVLPLRDGRLFAWALHGNKAVRTAGIEFDGRRR
ncbi:phosphopantothenate--cysteine ligase [Sphingomonas spermidinifaciens]|uniref:Phosphopantothenate--cysteine ligase n=1 Tax=Sphingomonas spermidinifaciens TaxID=1141889 RepID=A0A2A4B6T1_9SPHN|nr:putative photosynthetic complex assembly protein PuhE [Sphingomonas spermidinifaciens]PCD03635.1 phosphopantothenate--cysteine ligase [Sphingomonas spermidinifaciens]